MSEAVERRSTGASAGREDSTASNGQSSMNEEDIRKLSRKLVFCLLLPALGVAVTVAILGWAHKESGLLWGGLAAMAALVWLTCVARKPSARLLLLGGIMAWLVALAAVIFFVYIAVTVRNRYAVLKALIVVLPAVPFGYSLIRAAVVIRRAQEMSATKQNPYAQIGTGKDLEGREISDS